MGFSLSGLVRGIGNTINNDVLQPFQRDVVAPVQRGVTGAVEAINPWDGESRGNNLINQANQQYGFTPKFKGILDQANPVVSRNRLSSNLLDGVDASGLNDAANKYAQHGIEVRSHGDPSSDNSTLLHEGLHSVWNGFNPQERSNFLNIAQQSLPQGLDHIPTDNKGSWVISPRDQLQFDLKDYQGYKPGAVQDLHTLPEELQNEVHSYIPEYYQSTHQQLPQQLQSYYSQYYGAPQPAQQNGLVDNLKKILGRF